MNKEKDNSNGGEGDDGNDPDEIRNAVRNENLNISGLKEEAATGEGSGSGHKVTHGSSPPMEVDGLEIIMARMGRRGQMQALKTVVRRRWPTRWV